MATVLSTALFVEPTATAKSQPKSSTARVVTPPHLAKSYKIPGTGRLQKGPPIAIMPQGSLEPPRNVAAREWKSPYCTDWNDGCTRCVRREVTEEAICAQQNPEFREADCKPRGIACTAVDPRQTLRLCQTAYTYQDIRKGDGNEKMARRSFTVMESGLHLDDRGAWILQSSMTEDSSVDVPGQARFVPEKQILPGKISESLLKRFSLQSAPDAPTFYCKGWFDIAKQKGWIK